MLDDVYLWTENNDAVATIMDGDNEVSTDGALVCSTCQVSESASQERNSRRKSFRFPHVGCVSWSFLYGVGHPFVNTGILLTLAETV